MKPLLIEIGSEEIPARFVSIGVTLLKEDLVQLLKKSFIDYGSITEYATPRRLALYIDDVAEKQKDRTVEQLGPPRRAAFDAEGNPTKAASGFAGSLNIHVKDLTIKETERGQYVSAIVEEKGRPTKDVLSEALPTLITSLQLPKSMRWGSSPLRYFRPIHWIAAMLGSDVISFELDSVRSGNVSYGHRFLSPSAVNIKDPASYVSSLKQNHVLADINERKKAISKAIRQIETSTGCRVHKDEELLDTVTNLVEHPTAVLGFFEDKYLVLPKELLITVMRTHQKYFSMEDGEGNMKSSFIVVSNMNSNINDTVKRGAERVLRARLDDARFYFTEDQKSPLDGYVEGLKKVTFQEKLGTLYEKAERISTLSSFISGCLHPDLTEKAKRASMLCKADLVTGVVGEFPELQGYMGMTYARNSGEDEDISSAIYEHYLPRFAGDSMPSGALSAVVSIADKMDNIASFFYLDKIPSGSEDPFALRRQAAGIINILQSNDYPFTLNELIDTSLTGLEPAEKNRTGLTDRILQFFTQRLEGILQTQGHSHDVISAVLSSKEINLKDVKNRINIVTEFRKGPGFPTLLLAAKRVCNILAEGQPADIDESLLNEDEEKSLYAAADHVRGRLASPDYNSLFELEKPINIFFDSVLVMDNNPQVRENRLALLSSVRALFDTLCDFSKIVE
jgi:glycyl-tRNA synthetase beta chain